MPHNGQPTSVRVGIHTGSVVSGLIGTKLPKFSIFGDTMNTASRMESTCMPGCIQVSSASHELLVKGHSFTATGGVEVKGKGMMETYIWNPEDHPEEQYKSIQEQAKEAAALSHHTSSKKLPLLPHDVARAVASSMSGSLMPQAENSGIEDSGQMSSLLDSDQNESGSCPASTMRMKPGTSPNSRSSRFSLDLPRNPGTRSLSQSQRGNANSG